MIIFTIKIIVYEMAMSKIFYNKTACRQSEESRFPSRRFAPQDDAGRLEDRQV
jgi:hypothetical protein